MTRQCGSRQSGMDKRVWTKWYMERMVWVNKMVFTIWCGQNGNVLCRLIQLNSIYISRQKSQISDKHTEETWSSQGGSRIDEKITLSVEAGLIEWWFYSYHLYLYHFVCTILSIPFCPVPFCVYTILCVYHFVCIPFCPYHFVFYHFYPRAYWCVCMGSRLLGRHFYRSMCTILFPSAVDPNLFWLGATFSLLEGIRGHNVYFDLADTIYIKEWRLGLLEVFFSLE